MGGISPIMGLYGYVGNFQPVFVAKPAKFPAQKYRRNLDDFRKQMLSPKCLVWNESWSLAESEYVIGFTIKNIQFYSGFSVWSMLARLTFCPPRRESVTLLDRVCL